MGKNETENEKSPQPKGRAKAFAGDDLESLRTDYAKQQGVKEVQVQAFSHTPEKMDKAKVDVEHQAEAITVHPSKTEVVSEIGDNILTSDDTARSEIEWQSSYIDACIEQENVENIKEEQGMEYKKESDKLPDTVAGGETQRCDLIMIGDKNKQYDEQEETWVEKERRRLEAEGFCRPAPPPFELPEPSKEEKKRQSDGLMLGEIKYQNTVETDKVPDTVAGGEKQNCDLTMIGDGEKKHDGVHETEEEKERRRLE